MKKRMKEKRYQASFVGEAAFLVPFFCLVVCYFIFCVFFQYDLVRLQSNKIYMQYAQLNEEEMEEKADSGCLFFKTGNCEQENKLTKTEYEIKFYLHKGSFWDGIQITELQMRGEWDKLPVTEEIRLASIGMELLQ